MSSWIKLSIISISLILTAYFSIDLIPNSDKVIAYFYIRAGELFFHLGDSNKAELLYKKAINRSHAEPSSRLVKDLRLLAWTRYSVDFEDKKSVSLLKNALLVTEEDSEEMADIYRELGEVLDSMQSYEEAEKAWNQSIKLHRKLNNASRQFDVALKMAISYSARSEWSHAEKKLIEAISFRDLGNSEAEVNNHTMTEVCLLLGKLVLHIVKNKEKAFEYHLKACEHAKNSSLQQQVLVQIALGSYYESSDQFEEAVHKYQYALELCVDADMEEEEDYILHTIQGCLRKFSWGNPAGSL